MNLKGLKCRDELGEFLNQNGLLGVGLEVGSLSGEFARTIMSRWKGRQLIMLDPWCRQPSDVYKEPVNDTDWSSCMGSCEQLQREYRERIQLLRDYSPQAAAYFESGTLDFVYLDGNHSHEAVSADLRAWWPKVKNGGLFGGHDYRNDTVWPQNCEVKRAVSEWCSEMGLQLPHITRHPGCYSWWMKKI